MAKVIVYVSAIVPLCALPQTSCPWELVEYATIVENITHVHAPISCTRHVYFLVWLVSGAHYRKGASVPLFIPVATG